MGFGPKSPDPQQGAQAVVDIVTTLYPEHSTETCLEVLRSLAESLLVARAALSFETMAKFLADPAWRKDILNRLPNPDSRWTPWDGKPIDPDVLDRDFAWLLRDRLATLKDES